MLTTAPPNCLHSRRAAHWSHVCVHLMNPSRNSPIDFFFTPQQAPVILCLSYQVVSLYEFSAISDAYRIRYSCTHCTNCYYTQRSFKLISLLKQLHVLKREKRTMKHLSLTEKRALFTQKKEGASVMASIYLSHHAAFFFFLFFCFLQPSHSVCFFRYC